MSATFSIQDNRVMLAGEINFDSMLNVYEKGIESIRLNHTIIVDLQGIEQCDSSCLVLCTAWLREANSQNKSLVFVNVPSFMQDIMRVYGLDSILPIELV